MSGEKHFTAAQYIEALSKIKNVTIKYNMLISSTAVPFPI